MFELINTDVAKQRVTKIMHAEKLWGKTEMLLLVSVALIR